MENYSGATKQRRVELLIMVKRDDQIVENGFHIFREKWFNLKTKRALQIMSFPRDKKLYFQVDDYGFNTIKIVENDFYENTEGCFINTQEFENENESRKELYLRLAS